jgi:hypothetical protein
MPKKNKGSFIDQIINSTYGVLVENKIIEAKGRVNAGTLNIRQKPNLKAKVIGQLKRGDIVSILNSLDNWYQIIFENNISAFVYKKYIDVHREEKNGIITAKILNVREQPNTESPILGTLKKNDIVNILQEYQNWLKIKYNNREAFIYKTYVDISTVPLELNPIVGSNKYFYQRKDLATYPMQPNHKINVPNDYNEAIAANTWNNYGGLIEKISKELQIDVATALSVLCVESSGKGFQNDKMIIRFENHVFYLFWGQDHQDEFNKYFKFDRANRREGHYFRPSPEDNWEVCHTNQQMEWKVLEFAMKINKTAALQSISMGAPQIMGFNYKLIGYKSPQQMFDMFSKDIRYHLLALFDFCKYKPQRIRYLQRRDFYSFSVEYNGPTAPKAYEKRLLKYYHIYRNILSIS